MLIRIFRVKRKDLGKIRVILLSLKILFQFFKNVERKNDDFFLQKIEENVFVRRIYY